MYIVVCYGIEIRCDSPHDVLILAQEIAAIDNTPPREDEPRCDVGAMWIDLGGEGGL